jgi:Myb-like DNA-binding protein BAS1
MSAEPSQLEPLSNTRSDHTTSARRLRRSWNLWEDQTLRARVAHYGDARGSNGRWKEIAIGIPGRTAKDCRKRWFHSLDPSLRKGRWTEDEDRVLLSAYARLGPSWHEIAALIPGRKDDQCSKRYNDILDPLAQRRLTSWTPEEDRILREGVHTLGHRWSAISALLPGRPPLTCRNRWRNLSKQQTSPGASDHNTEPSETINEHPSIEMLSASPVDSPTAASSADIAAVNYQGSPVLSFHELDTIIAGGLDVPTDPNMFQDQEEVVAPYANDVHSTTTGGYVEPGVDHPTRSLNRASTGTVVNTGDELFRTSEPPLQSDAAQHTPVPQGPGLEALPISSNSIVPSSSGHQNTEVPIDNATIQSQLRASELAAERESMADQQLAPEIPVRRPDTNRSHATDGDMDIVTHNPPSPSTSVLVHQYHHHHHHHYHYHHHHHHYHHYTF